MLVMGLDVGDRRIGVALSDPEGMLAWQLTTIFSKGEEADLEAILSLARQNEVERIVVGLPLSMDGSIGQQAEKVLAFSRLLAQHAHIPVDHWDERLSTVAANRAMIEAGLKRAKRKARRDSLAAAIMLQAYLDRHRLSNG
jgi:putative Holliday junction resolvase